MQLIHGDCLDILPTIPTASVDLVLCDLPYQTTRNSWDSMIPLDRLWREYRRIIKPAGVIALTAQQPFSTVLAYPALDLLRYELVWKKRCPTGHLNAKRQPLKSHEQVLIFYKRQPTYHPQMTAGHKPYRTKTGSLSSCWGNFEKVETTSTGERYPISVLEFARDKDSFHPTQKPLALMEWIIATYTNPGDVVLDNAMGSGTTGVAAKRLDRDFIGMETDAYYFARASERIGRS